MIKGKLTFYLSLILLFTSMSLNFPFPDRYPYGETVFTILNIPIRFANGFHTVGIISLFLLIIGLYLLVKSLEKYHVRIVIATILIVTFAPSFGVSVFQKNFATGIYAVSYSNEDSNCNFETVDKNTLDGECELFLENHSKDDIQFMLEFFEALEFKDDQPVVSLMNNNAPHKVTLKAKENKHVRIKTAIDVSDMKNRIDGGEAEGVHIMITSEGQSRSL